MTVSEFVVKNKHRAHPDCMNPVLYSKDGGDVLPFSHRLAVNHGSCVEVGSSTSSQSICWWACPLRPEHFSVWSENIGLSWISFYPAAALSVNRFEMSRAKGKMNMYFFSVPPHGNADFSPLTFPGLLTILGLSLSHGLTLRNLFQIRPAQAMWK